METAGKQMHDDDAGERREAARAMGRARTPAKSQAAKERGEKFKGVPLTEETKRKQSEAQKLRWERVRAEKAAQQAEEPPAPKRPRGRPKKQEGQEANG